MIIVNSPIMQDKIIKILEAIEEPTFEFVKKDGIKVYFNTSLENKEEACAIAKKEIKKDPIASAIMFTVKSEEYI